MPATKKTMSTVTKWLDEYGIEYDLVEHPQAFTALEEVQAAEGAPEQAAKSVLLRDGDEYRLALIPALRRLDLNRAGRLLGATTRLRLATETEMAEDFPSLEVGAIPPLGPLLSAPEVLDSRLLEQDRILCSAGDHRHLLALDPNDLVRAVDPVIGDISEHRRSPHDEDFGELPHI
jgi:Ala-tRNA(Pro) deacylase